METLEENLFLAFSSFWRLPAFNPWALPRLQSTSLGLSFHHHVYSDPDPLALSYKGLVMTLGPPRWSRIMSQLTSFLSSHQQSLFCQEAASSQMLGIRTPASLGGHSLVDHRSGPWPPALHFFPPTVRKNKIQSFFNKVSFVTKIYNVGNLTPSPNAQHLLKNPKIQPAWVAFLHGENWLELYRSCFLQWSVDSPVCPRPHHSLSSLSPWDQKSADTYSKLRLPFKMSSIEEIRWKRNVSCTHILTAGQKSQLEFLHMADLPDRCSQLSPTGIFICDLPTEYLSVLLSATKSFVYLLAWLRTSHF